MHCARKIFREVNSMAMQADEILTIMQNAFPDAEIELKDLAGDQDHYELTIKSQVFNGKSRLQQHQLVYKALGTKMGNELHALALKTMAI